MAETHPSDYTPKPETLDSLNQFNMEWGLFQNIKYFFQNLFNNFLGLFSKTYKEAMQEEFTPQQAAAWVLENGSDKEKTKLIEAMSKESEKNRVKIEEYKEKIAAIQSDEKLSDIEKLEKIEPIAKKFFAITGPDAVNSIDFNMANGQTIKVHSRANDPNFRSRNTGIDVTILDAESNPQERIAFTKANASKIEAAITAAGGFTKGNIEALPKIEKDIENALILLTDGTRTDELNVKETLVLIQNTIESYPNQEELLNYLRKNTNAVGKDQIPTLDIPYLVKKETVEYDDNGNESRNIKQETKAIRLAFALNKDGRIEIDLYTNDLDYKNLSSFERASLKGEMDGFKRVGTFHHGRRSSSEENGWVVPANSEIFQFVDYEFSEDREVVFASKEFLEDIGNKCGETFKELKESDSEHAASTWSMPDQQGNIHDFYIKKIDEKRYVAKPVDKEKWTLKSNEEYEIKLTNDGKIDVLDGEFANLVNKLDYVAPFQSHVYDIKEQTSLLVGDTVKVRTGLFKTQSFDIHRDDAGNVTGLTEHGKERNVAIDAVVAAAKRPTVILADIVKSGEELAARAKLNAKAFIENPEAGMLKIKSNLAKNVNAWNFIPASIKERAEERRKSLEIKTVLATNNLTIQKIYDECYKNGYALTTCRVEESKDINELNEKTQMMAFSLDENNDFNIYKYEVAVDDKGYKAIVPDSIEANKFSREEITEDYNPYIKTINNYLLGKEGGKAEKMPPKTLEGICKATYIEIPKEVSLDELISNAAEKVKQAPQRDIERKDPSELSR